MGLYDHFLLPHLCRWAMKNERLLPWRQRVVGAARGHVLEIGIGAGANLPFYGAAVRNLQALEPTPRLLAIARQAAAHAPVPVRFIQASAEAIPLADHSIDSVVSTWTLCSIADASRALAEMRRVLKPGGELLFVEHGLAPEPAVQRWQRRLTPAWRRCAGGCHLNRPIAALIADAGFVLRQITTDYIRGPRPFTYFYQGRGEPR